MNGGITIFAMIALGIGVPVLFATMIADLTWRKIIALGTIAALIGGYFAIGDSDLFHRFYWQWTTPAPPAAEAAFIGAADNMRRQRADATATRTDLLSQARHQLCALPTTADNWIGQVTQRYFTNSGNGVSLTLEIWPHVMVRTSFFEDNSGTLIRSTSPLFSPVTSLDAGDVVRFSGRILGHDGACPGDPPVDRNESLDDSEFLLSFTALEKLKD